MRDGDRILMVRQQGPDDPHPWWFLPGGRIEPNETPTAALARELLEEAGIRADGTARPVVELETGIIFEIDEWSGEPRCDDPDGLVLEACFVDRTEALDRLRRAPHPLMTRELLPYLERTGG